MPIADRYVHDLVLQRGTPTAPDRTGHTALVYLPENYVPFKGNMQERTGVEVLGPALGGTIVADAICFADLALHVAEKDRIAKDTVMYDVVYAKALAFGSANDHAEILCRSVRSGQSEPGS
jgi:hypothetical protein